MAEITWTPYFEKMKQALEALPLAGLAAPQGRDVAALEQRLAAAGSAKMQAFGAEKLEKIVVTSMCSQSAHLGMCSIIPAPGCDLPIFFSRWVEDRSGVGIYVDLLPTVDILVDEPYRVKYIEPLGPDWERFANLPGIAPEEDDALRACSSIVYTAAAMLIEREGMRLAALAPHAEYLKRYIEFYPAAAGPGTAEKREELRRKTEAVRHMLRGHITRVLAGPAGQGIDPSVSADLAELFF
jgi:hypothetical protein